MKNIKKIASIALAAAMISTMFASVAMAATYKKINKVSITVVGHIQPEDKIGEEEIEITTGGGNYSFDYYEATNAGFSWTSDDTPTLKIYLNADDGYQFNISKASQITLNGATYKSATRESSATVLVVTVVMPSLANQVLPVEQATFAGESGECSWDAVTNAGSYEVKFMRGNTTLGGVQTVTTNSYNGRQYMTKEGEYYFKVKAYNKNDTSVSSTWTESNRVTISRAQADANKASQLAAQSNGSWNNDSKGWWFTLSDGSYPKSAWRYINNEWYYFLADGYMAKGWTEIGGKWYYMDPTNGNMWKNVKTPDGFELDINGAMITGDASK